ncbi:hypothetical protein [Kushneria konosiri]|uniref:hypothetical protein n=1 Tax=Kushneria konosiri TaxID=698828 RepID=UPI0011E4D172|nr:hypothetical protein [Kushneria konosiri]
MQEIFKKKYSRKAFFMVLVPALVLVGVFRYLILPCFDPSLKIGWYPFFSSLLDGLLFSTIVTVFIGIFIYSLTPEVVKSSKIDVTDPRELPDLFETAFSKTEIWWYKGGCGRYFRTKTLPEMASRARSSSLSREIKAVILDPMNTSLCEAHAIYRKSTASAKKEKREWDLAKVRNELCATIVSVLIAQRNEQMLRISLSLVSHYSAFRIDLSNDYVIITKEDRKAPAIICSSGSYFYKSYKDEMVLSENQGKRVAALSCGDYDEENLSGANVQAILKDVDLIHSDMMDKDFEDIARICKERDNPYGKSS